MAMALFAYFGIVAAAGVVINDNRVLVDYIRRLKEQGLSTIDAVIEAGVHRFRPILLTTVTTFIGLMPIMAERSIDAQLLKPAVVALAFGVLFALFLVAVISLSLLFFSIIPEKSYWCMENIWPSLRGRENTMS